MLLTSALLTGTWAAAQADPFLRTAPTQVVPRLYGAPVVPSARPTPTATVPIPPVPSKVTAPVHATKPIVTGFGNPRVSTVDGRTRVVFDLPKSMTYTLIPASENIKIEVKGAKVIAGYKNRLGGSVGMYRASGNQATLFSNFPLTPTGGWRAFEATIASGARVLILELSSQTGGGASKLSAGKVRYPGGLVAAPAPAFSRPPNTADLSAPPTVVAPPPPRMPLASAVNRRPSAIPNPPSRGSEAARIQPPGDDVGVSTPTVSNSLVETHDKRPLALSGRVPGVSSPGATIGAPRVGKNPGWTRMVLDLPPGTSYRIVTSRKGVHVELMGVSASGFNTGGQDISSEVRSWNYEPTSRGLNINFITGTPTTPTSGWRAELLPPATGDRSRLVVDLSPAMADTTPLKSRQKILAAVPPIQRASNTALLSVPASYVQPRVVLDPGHGGKFPGAVGTEVEKKVVLDVALRVRDILKKAGVNVVMTRETDRHLHEHLNTDLRMRPAMATPGTQLFVSIHANSIVPRNALRGFGVETWWNKNHRKSKRLATVLQNNMLKTTGAFDRGIHNRQSLAVLRNNKVPAALVEIGFLSHPVDGLNLKHNNYLDRIALGIATGIREALVSGVIAGTVPDEQETLVTDSKQVETGALGGGGEGY